MATTLRTATLDDVDAILTLWGEAAENRSRPADTRTAVELLLVRDPDALILATDDATDEVIGTIIVGWDGWRCHLYRLAVHPDRRRQRIGQALVDAAQRRASELGATRIDAMVLDDNDLGRGIWAASGFIKQDDWRRWVKPLPPSASTR
jgi:ribosomal protein S18 acetylase RimI-like enzyme